MVFIAPGFSEKTRRAKEQNKNYNLFTENTAAPHTRYFSLDFTLSILGDQKTEPTYSDIESIPQSNPGKVIGGIRVPLSLHQSSSQSCRCCSFLHFWSTGKCWLSILFLSTIFEPLGCKTATPGNPLPEECNKCRIAKDPVSNKCLPECKEPNFLSPEKFCVDRSGIFLKM